MLYERIREYLNKNRIPYSAVAEKIGKPLPIFSNMVNGKRKIEAEEYFAISIQGIGPEQYESKTMIYHVPIDIYAVGTDDEGGDERWH